MKRVADNLGLSNEHFDADPRDVVDGEFVGAATSLYLDKHALRTDLSNRDVVEYLMKVSGTYGRGFLDTEHRSLQLQMDRWSCSWWWVSPKRDAHGNRSRMLGMYEELTYDEALAEALA